MRARPLRSESGGVGEGLKTARLKNKSRVGYLGEKSTKSLSQPSEEFLFCGIAQVCQLCATFGDNWATVYLQT